MKNKNGFTLVELSIVLVVVGLLISGVLMAQSMIQSAKINSFSRQIQQYDIAVSNFKTKFKHLPGDAHVCGGNGDGYIQLSQGYDYLWQSEILLFWYYLSIFENIKEGNGSYSLSGTPVAGITMPLAKIGAKNTAIVGSTLMSVRPVFPNKHTYSVGGVTTSGALYYPDAYPAIAASDALAVDKKMDDGVANTGSVRAVLDFTGTPPDSTAGSGCVMNTNAAIYNTSSTSTGPCGLSILMLATNENSQ
jgi:prepilin-type N-terminal cleavage/methylation domain-containing protein